MKWSHCNIVVTSNLEKIFRKPVDPTLFDFALVEYKTGTTTCTASDSFFLCPLFHVMKRFERVEV
jgi:hypothetical protein